jgi:methyl-accepting chemotaxis protein
MDIRTKLIFACVAISLASMLFMGVMLQHTSSDMVRDLTARKLDALASARLEDIQIIRQAWREQAFLVTSRTALRELVSRYPVDPEGAGPLVQRILDDARSSVTIFRRLAAFDRNGALVAASGDAQPAPAIQEELADAELEVTGFVLGPDSGFDAVAHAPLDLGKERIGQLEAVVDTQRILDITQNYRGLGETGEMYLVAELVPDEFTVLHPLRGSDSDERLSVPRDSATEIMLAAVSGADETLRGIVDYRGERVWAATRKLPNLPVAIVVKIDEHEELESQRELRSRFLRVLQSVAALAILGGALLGTWLARPIRKLRDTIERIRGGERSLRAEVTGEDEVSFLAESFNELMDERDGDKAP